RRAEVLARRAGGRAGPETARAAGTTEATGPGAAESTAGTRARETTAATAATTGFTRPRFADRERTSHEGLLVEALNGLLGVAAFQELDERKPARTAGFPVDGQHYLRWR